jgi:acid phosphatase family membrane protein YuiD
MKGKKMDTFELLLLNKVLVASFTGWAIAQILKTVIHLILSKKFVAERLVGSGGMPSSHSATVCALATASYIEYTANSFQFAISLVFAFIVMYDAMGVRREAGNQAKVLNGLMDVFSHMEDKNIRSEEKLKEFIGHTPIQVIAGSVLGVVVAIFIC